VICYCFGLLRIGYLRMGLTANVGRNVMGGEQISEKHVDPRIRNVGVSWLITGGADHGYKEEKKTAFIWFITYTASSGNFLPTFRDNLLVPLQR